jgi:hypothetical protein
MYKEAGIVGGFFGGTLNSESTISLGKHSITWATPITLEWLFWSQVKQTSKHKALWRETFYNDKRDNVLEEAAMYVWLKTEI